ncbi:hypothetical protein ABW19_dt0204040 [Dactylella cylindrospora]|nr:hypothetical protein ABW19_dt0204040 [Dactylella cylindrospora]
MAANDNSFWLYGGFLYDTDSITNPPNADDIQVYDAYRQGVERIWERGWQQGAGLSNDVTRYVAGGAGVNVRDLNQTYYFSGIRHENWTEIRGPGFVRDQYRANVTSSRLITGDLTDQVRTNWGNVSLGDVARPRVNAEMVYIPSGKLGTLVVLGGVTNADWMKPTLEEEDSGAWSAAINESVRTGPGFLRTVEVYDINAKEWYLQNTTGQIPPTGIAQHCAVVASAKDGSSHQIYVYGGYQGQAPVSPIPYYDDVYVLSIPAFEWIKVYNGTNSLARKGHKCVKPLPDQMFIIGGRPINENNCIDMVRVFNLNKLEFEDKYDPASYEEYEVPEQIFNVIGGDKDGGATKTISRWSEPTLEAVFVSEKPPSKAINWYPYASVSSTGDPTSTVSIIETKKETPKYVYPVVGVCIFLVLLIIGGCIAFFLIRRKKQRAQAKAAGHEQFQNEKKGVEFDPYPQYPSAYTSPYGTANSMTTLGQSHHYSVDGYSMEHSGNTVYELPSDRNPAELDAGQEMMKLAVVQENGGDFSIVPTPATEASDPLSATVRHSSTRTARRSVFSEMTSPVDDGVSPLSPDPEMHTTNPGNISAQTETSSHRGWWRKTGSKSSGKSGRFSSFSSRRSVKSP